MGPNEEKSRNTNFFLCFVDLPDFNNLDLDDEHLRERLRDRIKIGNDAGPSCAALPRASLPAHGLP